MYTNSYIHVGKEVKNLGGIQSGTEEKKTRNTLSGGELAEFLNQILDVLDCTLAYKFSSFQHWCEIFY